MLLIRLGLYCFKIKPFGVFSTQKRLIINQQNAQTHIDILNYDTEYSIDPEDGVALIMYLGSNDEVIGITIDGFYVENDNGEYIGWDYNRCIEKKWCLKRVTYPMGYVDNNDSGEEIIVDQAAWKGFEEILRLTLFHGYIMGPGDVLVGGANYSIGFKLKVTDPNLPDTEGNLTLYFYVIFYPEMSLQ